MSNERLELEEQLRDALRAEAALVEVPPALWTRIEARLAQTSSLPVPAAQPGDAFHALARAGDLRGLVLALLAVQEQDHFTLARRVEELHRQARADPPDAVLLPLLHQLEGEGLLTARWRPGPHGPRRVYAAPAGGRGVRAWKRAVGLPARLAARLVSSRSRHAPSTE